MPCRSLYPEGGGFGFICSDIGGYMGAEEKFWLEEKKEEIKKYKFEFIKSMKQYTKCSTLICYHEVMAHIENVGVLELNFEYPSDDMEECVSYWCY